MCILNNKTQEYGHGMNWLCKHHFTLLLLQAREKKIPLTSDSTHKSTWF